jgi:3-hydroxyisobutyrate dehydrogenase-like beta-hydroxyacid dehydrogenase
MLSGIHGWRIGLIGYGEVGRTLAEDLKPQCRVVSAYDVELEARRHGQLRAHAHAFDVKLARSHAELAAQADLIISAVTASQTVSAARACASGIQPGAFFLDFNSASPRAKLCAAELIDGAGGRYIEAAVMSPVVAQRIRTPLLLGGQHAALLEPELKALGFAARVASEKLGVVSASKMCRNLLTKGFEALVIESLTVARAYAVEDDLLTLLSETFPGVDWGERASGCFRRVIQHGHERAQELREVAETVHDIGLTPWSASCSAVSLDWMATLADQGLFGDYAQREDWRSEADRILNALQRELDADTR